MVLPEPPLPKKVTNLGGLSAAELAAAAMAKAPFFFLLDGFSNGGGKSSFGIEDEGKNGVRRSWGFEEEEAIDLQSRNRM